MPVDALARLGAAVRGKLADIGAAARLFVRLLVAGGRAGALRGW